VCSPVSRSDARQPDGSVFEVEADLIDIFAGAGWRVGSAGPPKCRGLRSWSDGIVSVRRFNDCPGRHLFLFSDMAVVDVDADSREIGLFVKPRLSSETVRHLLLDQILPRVLALEPLLIVHAAAVETDGAAFLMIGSSGSGKSTLAASFQASGYELLGDDAVLIQQRANSFIGRAVYPSLRLREDSVREIFGSKANLRPVADYLAKWSVQNVAADIAERPVQAILLIDPNASDAVCVEPAADAKGCMAILAQSFALDPTDSIRARDRLECAGELVRTIPTFNLTYPRDYGRLAEVRAAIIDAISRR